MKKFSMILITLVMMLSIVFMGCESGTGNPIEPPVGDPDPGILDPNPNAFFSWRSTDESIISALVKSVPVELDGLKEMNGEKISVTADDNGNITIGGEGTLDFIASRRLLIGTKTTTPNISASNLSFADAELDLSRKFKITIGYTAGTAATGEDFSIWINNDTGSTSSNTLPPRIYGSETDPVLSSSGGTIVVEFDPQEYSFVGTNLAEAFICLRTASNTTISIAGIDIEYVGEVPEYGEPVSVAISGATEVTESEDITLSATVKDEDEVIVPSTEYDLEWTVALKADGDVNAVATIEDGVLTGVSEGEVTVTVKVVGTEITDTYDVTVNAAEGPLAIGDILDLSESTRHVGIDLSKVGGSGDVSVSFGIKVGTSSSGTDVGIVTLVDEDGEILAIETGLKHLSGSDNRILSAVVANTKKVYVLFSRNGSGGGGISITSFAAGAYELDLEELAAELIPGYDTTVDNQAFGAYPAGEEFVSANGMVIIRSKADNNIRLKKGGLPDYNGASYNF
jgi:ribosomal protein S28E/S33